MCIHVTVSQGRSSTFLICVLKDTVQWDLMLTRSKSMSIGVGQLHKRVKQGMQMRCATAIDIVLVVLTFSVQERCWNELKMN